MVRPVPVVHRGEHLVGLVDHELGADRDLDELPSVMIVATSMMRSLLGIEPGHLHVEPDQEVVSSHAATVHRRGDPITPRGAPRQAAAVPARSEAISASGGSPQPGS